MMILKKGGDFISLDCKNNFTKIFTSFVLTFWGSEILALVSNVFVHSVSGFFQRHFGKEVIFCFSWFLQFKKEIMKTCLIFFLFVFF